MRSRKIEKILHNLITAENSQGKSIITGYNYYLKCITNCDPSLTIFSNITNSKDYIRHAEHDLEERGILLPGTLSIRTQQGYFKWKSTFNLNKPDGTLDKGLIIRNYLSKRKINLDEICQPTLEKAGWDEDRCKYLIAQTNALEIDILINDKLLLLATAALFLAKSIERQENEATASNQRLEKCWPGAWDTPTIIIRKVSQDIKLPGFCRVIFLSREDKGEYSFAVNKKASLLYSSTEYRHLLKYDFKQEYALCNKEFIDDYVDE